MPPRFWYRAWSKASWLRLLYGTTQAPSMADAGVDAWIASQRDFPVSRGVSPVEATALTTSDGSGPTSRESFATFDRQSCSWKTCRPSLLAADSDSFSETWPSSGSMRNGRLSERPMLALRTVAIASSFSATAATSGDPRWPTPRAEDGESAGNHPQARDSLTGMTKLWNSPTAHDGRRPGNDVLSTLGGNLNRQAAFWPTPKCSDTNGERPDDGKRNTGLNTHAAQWDSPLTHGDSRASFWPTPAARDYKGENSTEHLDVGTGRKHLDQLPNYVRHCWPTPAATPYGSSQNGINGKGGANERPSAGTPSLERMSHAFRPDPPTLMRGDSSLPSILNSRQPSLFEMDAPAPMTTARDSTPGELTPKTKLNPQFVEWLMGLPIGWTGFALAETAWCRWRQQSRSALSGIGW